MARYSKFIVAVIGAIAIAVSKGFLDSSANDWVEVAIPILTAIGVYAVPNATVTTTTSTTYPER